MVWLRTKNKETLETWLRETSIPMLATMPNGDILWANQAYEDLVGFTLVELQQIEEGWKWLTVDDADTENDTQMAGAVVHGERTQYHFRKQYRHKSGEFKSVEIHVLRYPLAGEFQFFLVSVIALDHGFSKVIEEMDTMKEIILRLAQRPDAYDKVKELVMAYPKITMIALGALLYLIFGDRVLEIYKAIIP